MRKNKKSKGIIAVITIDQDDFNSFLNDANKTEEEARFIENYDDLRILNISELVISEAFFNKYGENTDLFNGYIILKSTWKSYLCHVADDLNLRTASDLIQTPRTTPYAPPTVRYIPLRHTKLPVRN